MRVVRNASSFLKKNSKHHKSFIIKILLLTWIVFLYQTIACFHYLIAQEIMVNGKKTKISTIHGGKVRHIVGEIIVKFKPSVTKKRINEFNASHGVRIIKYYDYPMDMYLLSYPLSKKITEIIAYYDRSGLVEFADCNAVGYGGETPPPDDYQSNPLAPNYQWSLSDIRVPEAWDIEKGSQDVIVAVIDSGINYNHEEFTDQQGYQKLLRDWHDFVDGDDDPFDATNGHGTAVAGIISAYTNNNKGIAGICRYCRILVYRVSTGQRYGINTSVGNVVDALLSVIVYNKNHDKKVKIVNLSLSFEASLCFLCAGTAPLRFATLQVAGADILQVVSSGNDCAKNDGVTPGCGRDTPLGGYPWVLTVGASTQDGRRAFYSDWPNDQEKPGVDVVAPSGVPAPYVPDANSYTSSFRGTSAAAPHVAGVAALIWSANPHLSAIDVKKIIRDTADDITEDPVLGLTGLVGWDPYTGYGKVNAYKAVKAALPTITTTPDATGRVAQVWWPEIRQLQRVEILRNRPFVGVEKLCDVFSVAYSGYFFWDGRCGDTVYPIGTYSARADGVEKPISLLPDTTPPDAYFDISDNIFYNNGSYPLRMIVSLDWDLKTKIFKIINNLGNEVLSYTEYDYHSVPYDWNGRTGVNGDLAPTGDYVAEATKIDFAGNFIVLKKPFMIITDTTSPNAKVALPFEVAQSRTFTVSWQGQDNPNGSGIDNYTVRFKDQTTGTPWQDWKVKTTATSALFTTGQPGHVYYFEAIACDRVGNCESFKETPEATVTVVQTFSGKVLLSGQSGHSGTVVELTNLKTSEKISTTTLFDGTYSFTLAPHYDYNIKVSSSISAYIGIQRNFYVFDKLPSLTLGEGKVLSDSDGDGCITQKDFRLIYFWFIPLFYVPNQPDDMNLDGKIDFADVALSYDQYGFCSQPLPAPKQSSNVAITINHPITGAPVGSVTPVSVKFNSEKIQVSEVHLNFDPTALQVVDADGNPVDKLKPGNVFNQVIENIVDNVAGKIIYTAGRTEVLSDLAGTTLVQIYFKRISDKPAEVTFDNEHPPLTITSDGVYETALHNSGGTFTNAQATLYFSPSAKQIGPGEPPVKVEVKANGVAPLKSVTTEIRYNPEHVQVVDASGIPVTKIQGKFTDSENSVNPVTGVIKYSGVVPQVGTQGEQVFATFYVKVMQDGLSEIQFTPPESQHVVLETGAAESVDFGNLSIGNKPDTTAPTITNLVSEPEIFSPDGDGVEDETAFTFTASEALSKVVLQIKDKNDSIVREITQFTPQKPYRIVWDGKDTQGNVVPSGTYTAELHAFDWAQNEGMASVKSYVATMPVNVVVNQTAHHKAVLSTLTDIPTKVTVLYGLTTEYDQFVESLTTTTIHTLVLTNLEASKTVHYRVFARTEDDKMGITKDKTFATLPVPTGTLAINDGASFTNNSQITLNLFAQIPGKGTFKDLTDIEKFYHVKNKDDQDFTAYATYPDSETISWTLPSGDGLKEVHVQYKDTISLSNTVETDSEESSVISKQIILDTKAPEITSFHAQKLTIGVIKLLWQANDENGIARTKIYRSDDVITDLNKKNAFLAETSEFSFTNTDLIPGTLYTYAIETVDVAGNVSPISESISIRAPTIEGTLTISNKDNKAPEFVNDQNVVLNITATAANGFDVTEMALSTDGSDWQKFEPLTDTKPWTLSETNGTQNVFVKFRGSDKEESGVFSDGIVLDTTPPANAALTALPGNSPNINLFWSPPFDFSGISKYILYRAAFPITSDTKAFADVLAPSLPGNTANFIDSTGTPGDTYYYALQSFDRFGLSSLSNSPSAKVILVNPLQSVKLSGSGGRKNVSIGEIVTIEIEGKPGLGAVQVALVDGSKPFDSGTIGSTFVGASEFPLNSGHYHGFVSLTHDIPFKTIKAVASAIFGNFTNPVVSSNALCIGCAGALSKIEVSLNPTVIANNPNVNLTSDPNSPPVMVKRFTAKGFDAYGTEVPLGPGFSFLGLQAVSAEHPSDSWSANIGTISLSETPSETYLTVPVPVPPPYEPAINPYWTQVKSSDLSLTLKNPNHLNRLVATSTQNTTPSYVGLYHDLYGTTINDVHTMAVQTRQKAELEAVLSSASVQDGGAGLMLGLDNLKTSTTPIGRPNTLFFGALNGQSAVFKLCDDNGVCETKTLDAAPPDENTFHTYRLVIHPIGAGNFKRVTELYSANASFNKATPNFLDEHTLIFSQATQAPAGTSFAPPGIFRMNEFDAQSVYYTTGYDPALSVPLNKLVFLNYGQLYWMYPDGSFPCRDYQGNLTQPCSFGFPSGVTESPSFSKDGSKLVFYHSDSTLQNAGIFLYDFNTNQHTKVANENLYPHPFPSFSHDGQSLLYYVQEQGRPKLIQADFSGNILKFLTSLNDPGMYSVFPTSRAATSSDGKYIYYPSGINWTRMLSDGTGKEPFWSPLGYLGFPADDLTFLKGTDKIAFVLKPSFFTTGIITKRELTVGFENDPQIDMYYDNETGTPDDTVYLSFHNSLPQYGLHASSGSNEPLKAVFDNISLLGIPPFSDDFSSDFYVAKSEGAIKGKAKIFFGSDSSPPSHITDLSAVQGTGPKVFLSWSLPKDDNEVYGYRVYKSREPITQESLSALSFSFFSNYAATPTPKYLDLTSLIDPGVSVGDMWYYALQAVDTSGNIASLSNVAQVTITSSVSSPEIIANVLSSKQALSGALVLVKQGTTVLSQTTDAQGYARFPLAEGSYVVVAKKQGYTTPSEQAVTVSATDTKKLSFSLSPYTNHIQGKVTSGSMPLPGVILIALEALKGDRVEGVSKDNGSYDLPVDIGLWKVTAEKAGYITQQVNVNIPQDACFITGIDFDLVAYTSKIKGVVANESGKPMSNITVKADGAFSKSATTDETGNYEMTVAPSSWIVSTQKYGFSAMPVFQQVVVENNGDVKDNVNFTLMQLPINRVTVSGTEDGTPQTVSSGENVTITAYGKENQTGLFAFFVDEESGVKIHNESIALTETQPGVYTATAPLPPIAVAQVRARVYWTQTNSLLSENVLTLEDMQPPTAPTNLTAELSPDLSIALNWERSSDNVGVKNYVVLRHTETITPENISQAKVLTNTLTGLETFFTDTEQKTTGRYYYVVLAKDYAGNASRLSNVVSVLLQDTQPPSAITDLQAVLIPGNGQQGTGNRVQLTWSGATDNVGVVRYKILRIENEPVTDANKLFATILTNTLPANARTFLDTTVSTGHTYYYAVTSFDASGNESPLSNSPSVIIPLGQLDTTPPQITNVSNTPDPISPNNSFGTKDATTITANIIEDHLKEWKTTVKDSTGAAVKEYMGTSTNVEIIWNGTDAAGNYVTDGLYKYVITATDFAGNSSTSAEHIVTIDNTNPTAAVEFLGTPYTSGGNLYVSGNTQLTIKGNDPVVNGVAAGIEKTQYAVDQQQTPQTYTTPFTLQEGPHTLRYSAQDFAGNTSLQQQTQVNVDTTAPVTTLSPMPQAFTKTKNFTLSANDPRSNNVASGIRETKYVLDGAPLTTYLSGITLNDGYHTLEYFSTDNVGNEEHHHTVTFTVDTIPPQVTNINDQPDPFSPGNSPGVKDTNTISANINDANPDTWQLQLFDAMNHPVQNFSGTGSSITQLWNGSLSTGGIAPDGLYSYSLLATDKAGNSNKQTSGGSTPPKTLLQDDFNNNVLDPAKWDTHMLPLDPGLSVVVENGQLRILGAPQAQNPGDLITGVAGIASGDVTKKLSLSVDVDVSHSQSSPSGAPVASLVLLGSPAANKGILTMNVVLQANTYVLMYRTFSGQEGFLGNISAQGKITMQYDPTTSLVHIFFNAEEKGQVVITLQGAALSVLAATGGSGSFVDVRFDNVLFTQEEAGGGQVMFTPDGYITVDNTNPVSTLTPSTPLFNNQYASTSATYSIAADDPIVNSVNSGIEKIEVAKDNEAFFTYTSALTLDEGKHTLKHKATDNAGNTEQEKTFSVDVDGTAPVTTATPSAPLYNNIYAPLSTMYTLSSVDPVVKDVSSGVMKIIYKVDSGAETQYGTAISLTEGMHTITYYAKDNVLNTEQEKTLTVKVDNTAPVTQLVPSQPLYANKYAPQSTTYTFTATDPITAGVASGVAKIQYTLDGGVTNTYAGQPVSLTEGIHTFTFFAVDNVGNAEQQKTFVVNVDNTPPVTALSTGNPKYQGDKLYIASSTPISLSAQDPLSQNVSSGVAKTEYKIDSGNYSSYVAVITLPEGVHTLTYRSADNVGNTEQEKTQVFYVDGTAPVTTATPSAPLFSNIYAPLSTTYSLSAVDPVVKEVSSGVLKTVYKTDGGAETQYSSALSLTEGIHTLTYFSKDNVLNTETEKTFTVKVDNTPPVTQFVPSAPLYANKYAPLSTTYTFSANDPQSFGVSSGVSKIEYTLDGGVTNTYNGNPISLTEGVHTFTFFATDNVGNKESQKSVTVYVDNTPPVTNISTGDPKYVSGGKTYVSASTPMTLSASDPTVANVSSGVSSTQYKIDSGNYVSYASAFVLTEGIHTIIFRSTDNVGNVESEKTQTYHVDATPPTAQISVGAPQCMENGKIIVSALTQFNITATDPVVKEVSSGVNVIRYRINSGAWQSFTSAFTLQGQARDGDVTLSFQAIDHVENAQVVQSLTVILDTTPPVTAILSPQDKSVVNNTIAVMGTVTDAHFTNGNYTVQYGSGQNPTSFTTMNTGATQNTCTAQSASCEPLTTWNTTTLTQNALYTLKLSASDCVGNSATSQVLLRVGEPEFVLTFGTKSQGQQPNNGEFNEPAGLATVMANDGSGNIAVSDKQNHRIQIFTDKGQFITKFGQKAHGQMDGGEFNEPTELITDSSGNLYVVDSLDDRVQKFDKNYAFIAAYGSHGNGPGQFNKPYGVARDATGNLYVTDMQNNRVQKLDSNGNFIKEWTSIKKTTNGVDEFLTFNKPSGILVDATGNLYVSDSQNDRILKFAQDGMLLRIIDATGQTQAPSSYGDHPLKQPLGMMLDNFGNVYVADQMNHRVQKFDPWGFRLLNFGTKTQGGGDPTGTFNQVADVLLDSTQKFIFVSDIYNHRVQRFAVVINAPVVAKLSSTKKDDKNTIISDPNLLNVLRVAPYPTPSHGKLSFDVEAEGNVVAMTLEVYSINGKRVLVEYLPVQPATGQKGKGKFKAESPSLNAAIESLPNGVYVYRLQISNGVKTVNKTGKFVVVK